MQEKPWYITLVTHNNIYFPSSGYQTLHQKTQTTLKGGGSGGGMAGQARVSEAGLETEVDKGVRAAPAGQEARAWPAGQGGLPD